MSNYKIIVSNENKRTFADNLEYFMKLHGKTRSDVCKDLEIGYSSLSSWLLATNYPRIEKIEQLAQYFNIEKSALIESKFNVLPPEEIGKHLKEARLSKGLTQRALSEALDVGLSTIKKWEKGQGISNIRVNIVKRIEEVLGIPDALVFGAVSGIPENFERQQKIDQQMKTWNDNFGDVLFSDEEFNEIISYTKYILSKRPADDQKL